MVIPGVHIKIESLAHRYRARSALVLDRVEAEVAPGEALAILGRSGCGKSTLLHILAGLMRPSAGAVYLDGKAVDGPSPRWVMMFQQPSLFPWMRVAQNVGIGLRFAHLPKAEVASRVAEALRLVDLESHAEANVQDLSGGQQQRVALARSLVMKPELLLLDEPFSALDAFTRAALQRDVRSIAKRLGLTLVIVTHDIDEAALMADRALIMAGPPGTIVEAVTIDIDDPRDRKDPAVRAARERLMKSFEAAAGPFSAVADTAIGSEAAAGARPATETLAIARA